jgi:hypothetical protein
MLKKFYDRDRDGAAALLSGHRTVALFVLCVLHATVSTGRAWGQPSQIGGGQMRIATNLQTGTSYTVSGSDCGKLLSFSGSNNVAVSVPQAGATGLASGCWIDIQNAGTGTASFTVAGSSVDGASGFTLASNQGLRLFSTGSSYLTQRGQGSGGSGSLSVQSDGSTLGTANTLNVVGGTGVACVPQVNAGTMTFQCNADTSYLVSKTNLQGATNPQVCTSSSGNGAVYTAGCASPLTAYGPLQTLFWFADVANTSTTPTLNIDTLGANMLVRQDGTALAVNDIKAGALYRIWYDGTNVRVVEAGLSTGSTGGGGATTTRGVFASRGACASPQSGNTFYSTDIAHFSECDGTSWADYYQGQPVSLPGSTSFTTLNGTGATITTNGISTISAVATASTSIIGQEIAVPAGSWTIVASLQPNDQGVVNNLAPARLIYVRDGSNKMVALYGLSALYYGNQLQWTHISSPTGTVTSVLTLADTGQFVPFLRIHYDGTNFTYSGCTTYNAATTGGANNFGGGNCETYYFEAATAYLSAPVAVGWGMDTHSGGSGSSINAVTAIHWQVTN